MQPEIVNYVRTERARGVSEEDIKKSLRESGWTDVQIGEVFALDTAEASSPSVHVPLAGAMPQSIKYFFYTVCISVLATIACSAVGPLPEDFYGPETGMMRYFAIAIAVCFGVLEIICAYLISYRRSYNLRVVFLIWVGMSVLGSLSAVPGIIRDVSLAVFLIPVLLRAAAIYMAFLPASNAWIMRPTLGKQGLVAGGTVLNTMWAKFIPRTNHSFFAISLTIFLTVDTFILITSPDLLAFWIAMGAVMVVFAGFYYFENVFLRKKLMHSTKPKLDYLIAFAVVVRNIIFFLNVIPLIQLIGFMGIVFVGPVLLIVYVVLVYLRCKAPMAETTVGPTQ